MHPTDADGMAHRADPDQTAKSSLIWVYTLFPDLSVQKMYRKNPKISETWKFAVIILKAEQDGFSLE